MFSSYDLGKNKLITYNSHKAIKEKKLVFHIKNKNFVSEVCIYVTNIKTSKKHLVLIFEI